MTFHAKRRFSSTRSGATVGSRNRFVMPAEHPVSQATITTSFA
jgi:hypothetical protein